MEIDNAFFKTYESLACFCLRALTTEDATDKSKDEAWETIVKMGRKLDELPEPKPDCFEPADS